MVYSAERFAHRRLVIAKLPTVSFSKVPADCQIAKVAWWTDYLIRELGFKLKGEV